MSLIIRVKDSDIVFRVTKTQAGFSVRAVDGNIDFIEKYGTNTVLGRGKTVQEAVRNTRENIKEDLKRASKPIERRTKRVHGKQLVNLKRRKNILISESTKKLPHPARIGSTFSVRWLTLNGRILEEERVSFSARTGKKVTDLTPLELRKLVDQASDGAVAQIIQQFESAQTDSIIQVTQTGPVVYRYLQDKSSGRYIKERVFEFEPTKLPLTRQARLTEIRRIRKEERFAPREIRQQEKRKRERAKRRAQRNQ